MCNALGIDRDAVLGKSRVEVMQYSRTGDVGTEIVVMNADSSDDYEQTFLEGAVINSINHDGIRYTLESTSFMILAAEMFLRGMGVEISRHMSNGEVLAMREYLRAKTGVNFSSLHVSYPKC
jgi:hypothetical protein